MQCSFARTKMGNTGGRQMKKNYTFSLDTNDYEKLKANVKQKELFMSQALRKIIKYVNKNWDKVYKQL